MLKTISSKTVGFFYVAAASVTWGTNGVIVNYVDLSPFSIAFFRVFFASLFLFPILYLKTRRALLRATKVWKSILSLGVLLACGWGFLFQSMKLMSIADAVLLNYTAPVIVTLLGPIFLHEKIERSTVFALGLSLAGIGMISYQYGFQLSSLNSMGVIFGLLASLSYAAFVIISKKTLAATTSTSLAFWMYSISAIILFPSIIGTSLDLALNSWLLLLLLGGINTGLAVTLYLEGLKTIKTQKAVVLTYLEPLFAIFFGSIFLSQKPTFLMIAGGSLILIASYLAVSK
jgi:drug/metabolite transporter (DMT)-like permease